MGQSVLDLATEPRRLWNADQIVGTKRSLKPRDILAISFDLDEHRCLRDRAFLDLAIDSKLRGCDVVKLKINDVIVGGSIRNRATVIQQKVCQSAFKRDPLWSRIGVQKGPLAAPWWSLRDNQDEKRLSGLRWRSGVARPEARASASPTSSFFSCEPEWHQLRFLNRQLSLPVSTI